jgi:hydroxyacylglutathione hydrolase
MMLKSLSALRALPEETKVYFGHEYTETNLRFALTLEPNNKELKQRHEWTLEQGSKSEGTTPTTIGKEKRTNPFFRWDSNELRSTLQRRFSDVQMDDVSVFGKTRALKDQF